MDRSSRQVMELSTDTHGALVDLYVTWERLLHDRCHARPGRERSELDSTYARVLPTIVAITEAVDDQEINNLVRVAGSLLKSTGTGAAS